MSSDPCEPFPVRKVIIRFAAANIIAGYIIM